MTPSSAWTLDGFEAELDSFYERESSLSDDVHFFVLEWALSRMDDPYAGAIRPPELGSNWWFARIPATYDPAVASVVTCTYQIFEAERLVLCRSYAWLRTPIQLAQVGDRVVA